MKARIKATNEVAEILKAEQYASSGEYRFFWLDIDKPEPFNRFRPDEVELIDDIKIILPICDVDEEFIEKWKNFNKNCCGQIIISEKFTQQDVNDLRLLSELAFDGACMSDEDEKLIKRVVALADKIEAMI